MLKASISTGHPLGSNIDTNSGLSVRLTNPTVINERMQDYETLDRLSKDVDKLITTVLYVERYNSKYEFPNIGKAQVLYIDMSVSNSYQWDTATATYYPLGLVEDGIESITGGNAYTVL